MATVTINGTELSTDDPKTVRRALDKARRDEKKAEDITRANEDRAHTLAQANGYRLLSWKLEGNGFPGAFEFHRLGTDYCRTVEDSIRDSDTRVMGYPEYVVIHHYGQQFLGVLAGAGYPMAVFLRDDDGAELCFALGTSGTSYSLAHCIGIVSADFTQANR